MINIGCYANTQMQREGTPEIPFRDNFEYREDRLTSMPFEIQFHVLCNADHFIFHHFHEANLGFAIQISIHVWKR